MLASQMWVRFLPLILLATIILCFVFQKLNGNVSNYDYRLPDGTVATTPSFEAHFQVSPKNDVSLVYVEILVVLFAFFYPILATQKSDVKNYKKKCFVGFLIGCFSLVVALWGWYGFLPEFSDIFVGFLYTGVLVAYLLVTGFYRVMYL